MMSAEVTCEPLALTQSATEKTWRLNQPPKSTAASTPFKATACPTLPAWNVTPPLKVPLCAPSASLVSPCPRHQLTRPEGGGTHGGCGLTVNIAAELVAVPYGFVTTAAYAPDWFVVTLVRVRVA